MTSRAGLHRIAFSLLVLVAVARSAGASTLDFTGWALGETVRVAGYGSLATAEFGGSLEGDRGFSYSVELSHCDGPDSSSDWTILGLDSDALIRAAWLVATFHPEIQTLGWASDGALGITRETAIAALQVAVWEVMSDASGNYSLTSGAFALQPGGASSGVVDLAYAYLGALSNASLDRFTTSSVRVHHKNKPDQLFTGYAQPVTEPAPIVLCAIGLALAGALRRSSRSDAG